MRLAIPTSQQALPLRRHELGPAGRAVLSIMFQRLAHTGKIRIRRWGCDRLVLTCGKSWAPLSEPARSLSEPGLHLSKIHLASRSGAVLWVSRRILWVIRGWGYDKLVLTCGKSWARLSDPARALSEPGLHLSKNCLTTRATSVGVR